MKSKMVEDEGAASGSEVRGPIRQVILISAGASHSVALLCKFIIVGFVYIALVFC